MTSIIFQNIYDKLNESTQNINDYFNDIDFYNKNIYILFQKLPKYNIIIYIFIIFIIFNFISKFNIRLNEILSLFISIILIYFLMEKDYTSFILFTNTKKKQLKFLHNLMFDNNNWITITNNYFISKPFNSPEKSYLYLNPLIVQLFYNIKNYSSFNISSYVNSLFHCNNVLGIEYEVSLGLNREYLNYETAQFEKDNDLNELCSDIYNIPHADTGKYRSVIKTLHSLLASHMYNISQLLKNKNELNPITVDSVPNDLYDIDFFIKKDDTHTPGYMSVFNLY
jgi:hypothetical protein